MITKHPTSRTLIVRPIGNLEALTSDFYRQQMLALLDEGYVFVIFDLEETSHVNSSGLGLLVEIFNLVRKREGALKLIHCNDQILWILRQSKLDRLLLGEDGVPTPIAFDPLHAMMSREILLMSQIHSATERIMKLDQPDEVCMAITQDAVAALDASYGVFLPLNETGDRISLLGWHAPKMAPTFSLDLNLDVPLRAGQFEAHLIERDEVLWRNLRTNDDADAGLFRMLGFEMLLATPVYGQNRKFGILALEMGTQTGPQVPFAKPMMQTLAHLCGLALQKLGLMEKLTRRNEELSEALERERQYQVSLIDAGHLVSMGAVIGGLCHLLNNKMVPLVGYSQLLSQATDIPDSARRKVATISESTQEIAQTIEKLVKIGRLHERTRERVVLGDLLHTVLDLLTSSIRRRSVSVQLDLASDAPEFTGDCDQLLQAMLAVLHYSCRSFEDDGGRHWMRIATAFSDGTLSIVVEDNGKAFSEDSKPDWVDPLVREEEIMAGQIFSYTIPRGVIRRMQGRFTLEERQGGGKRVIIELPIATDSRTTPVPV